jgi:hypothetical protein
MIVQKPRLSIGRSAQVPALGFALAAYVSILAYATSCHESWFDEAQAWLIARDLSPLNMWPHYIRYEGTPALWHTILMIAAKLGLAYESMHVIACLAAIAATILLLWRSPFPLWVRLLLPFSYFLLYQYAVVARSYTLLPLLFFWAAVLLPKAREQTYSFIFVLILMANVSVQGTLAATGILAAYLLSLWSERKSLTQTEIRRHAIGCGVFMAVMLLLVWQLWPPRDLKTFNVSPRHLVLNARTISVPMRLLMESLSYPGTANSAAPNAPLKELPWIIAGAVALVLSINGFVRARTVWYFVLPTSGVFLLSGVVYANRWHSGVFLLIWLFAMWATVSQKERSPIDFPWLVWILILAPQIYWSAKTIQFDSAQTYSGSKAVAKYLKDHDLENHTIFAAGYETMSIQPYFTKNLFRNYGPSDHIAFWEWREANPVPQEMSSIPEERPDVLIVAQRSDEQQASAKTLINSLPHSGYSLAGIFEGHLYWKSYVIEAESFLVIRKD